MDMVSPKYYMGYLNEINLNQLYNSTVLAFPYTMKRQYATDTIKVVKLDWTPFVGMKTLFVKGLVENEGHLYNTMLLFKKVNYDEGEKVGGAIALLASDGMVYHLGKIDERENDVLVRCSCPDYRYRFAYYNKASSALWGAVPKKYEAKGIRPPANPLEKEGMCKHIMKTTKALSQAGLFS